MDKARILVVDDTPDNLNILSELLSPEHKVNVALNGKDALRIASTGEPPDLVLMDIMMPGMDGYEVCTALKANEQTRQIPIVFVTAMNELEDEEKGLELGAVDYITKPFNPSIVLARVKTHLSLYNQTRLLQSLVNERTTELEKARDEAELANRAKSTFLANMSHELRTPLNGILGITQLLLATDPTKDQKEFLKDGLESSSRMLTVVNDLLELSKAEAGKVHLCPCQFSTRESLDQFFVLYNDQANQKGLDFTISIDPDVPDMLYADIGHIRQILMNLLNNAFRFTDNGSVEVSVNTWGECAQTPAGTGSLICFNVKDTGVGIPDDNQEYVFEPFSIGENFMTKVKSGAGLGLSISKRLVDLMGGHIWLKSQDGAGTTVSFTIPCGLCSDSDDEC